MNKLMRIATTGASLLLTGGVLVTSGSASAATPTQQEHARPGIVHLQTGTHTAPRSDSGSGASEIDRRCHPWIADQIALFYGQHSGDPRYYPWIADQLALFTDSAGSHHCDADHGEHPGHQSGER